MVAVVKDLVPEDDGRPILRLGDTEFVCVPKHMPFGTVLKFATANSREFDLPMMRALLVKLIEPERLDEFWECLDEVGPEAGQVAISAALESYTVRPTKKS